MPKVFNRIRRMREKSLSEHGDCGDFRVDLDVQSHLRIRQEQFSVHGEYAEEYNRIWRMRQEYFATSENTPIDIKLRLSRRISAQNKKKILIHNHIMNMIEWAKNRVTLLSL
jgi:hypothetical protein